MAGKINTLKNFISENNMIDNLKNSIRNKINSNITHKSTLKSFIKYLDSLGDDIQKLQKFNKQLDNLSKSVNTLSRLFKSFTSKKRTEKIKQTTEFKQALLPQFVPDNVDDNRPIKIRKSKQEKKNKIKKLIENKISIINQNNLNNQSKKKNNTYINSDSEEEVWVNPNYQPRDQTDSDSETDVIIQPKPKPTQQQTKKGEYHVEQLVDTSRAYIRKDG